MKRTLHSKILAAILAFVMLFALIPATAFAAGSVAIDATNFPNEIFREYVKQFDTDADGTLSASELGAVTKIDVGERGISSLKGIEYFTELEELECYNHFPYIYDGNNNTELKYPGSSDNNLTELDVSKNTKLIYLDCGGSGLTSLDVSKNTALIYLDCSASNLTSLDVSKNTALTYLDCSASNLTSLDMSNNTALEHLVCYYNNLTSLDVSKNTALLDLNCSYNNNLMSLDVSKNTALTRLGCNANNLTELDVSKNIALEDLGCNVNNLTELDVSKNTALRGLDCSGNALTSLDVSKNTALGGLDCSGNALTSLDVSNNTALINLWCNDNDLISLDVSKNTALEWLYYSNNAPGFKLIKTRENPFTDVKASDYYYDAVQWAVRSGITTGTGKEMFSPNSSCTRAQIVTFLWRTAESPKATSENPFTDVKSGDYYYDAVLWAVENGITTGTSATTFSPNSNCTRAQIVTFLWRAAGSPKATSENPFTDVKSGDYYYDAVLWAVENGITTGTGATTFSPDAVCTRAQAVTFLYRAW